MIREEQENWINEDPLRTGEQNIKVAKILEEAKQEKGGVILILITRDGQSHGVTF